jgi:hypothetical protein
MKLLFARFTHLEMVLEDVAFSMGYMERPTERICHYLSLQGRPIHPSRKYISVPELRRLIRFMERLVNHPTKLELIIRPKSLTARVLNSCL